MINRNQKVKDTINMSQSLDGEPKIFTVIRHNDESGVSGRGRVLDGILFPCGKVVVCWRVQYQSIAIYESFSAFKAIHIDSHPTNHTEIIWSPTFNYQPTEQNNNHQSDKFNEYSEMFGS